MPTKKVSKPIKKPTGSKIAATKKVTATKSKQTKKDAPTKKVGVSSSTKSASSSLPKIPTKEDIAAVQIQKNIRRFLAKKQLLKLQENKKEYEKTLQKIQKEAYAAMIKSEQEAALREQIKQEDERKKERERKKRIKRMLEAAFDGDKDEMESVMLEVSKADDASRVKRDEIGQIIRRMHQLEVIESCDVNDYTPLSEASAGGSTDAIQFLLERGADVNSIGAYGRSPLYRAAFAGHLSAVELLLQNGADPRIVAHDGCTAAEVTSVEQVTDVITSWDLSVTEHMLEKRETEKARLAAEAEKRRADEQSKLKNNLDAAKKESDRVEKMLLKAYHELEKRINEHDTMVAEGNDRMAAVTLETVKRAEEDLEFAKLDALKAKTALEELRLDQRDQQNAMGDLVGVKCNFRELEEVLFKDVGDRIKSSGKWPLLIDTSGQASVFLRYRDTNYVCTINPSQMQADKLRLALLGSIRFGKPLVLDMMEVDMFDSISNCFDQIQPGLLEEVMSKDLLQDEKYMKLVKPTDDSPYQVDQFMHQFAFNFTLVIITKNSSPPEDLVDKTYPIRVVMKTK